MQIYVTGQHMKIGQSFKEYIEENVEKHVKKYFDKAVQATVTITKEKPHYIKADILINQGVGSGTLIKSSAHDDDPYRSFDEALQKADKQLKKYKNRIKAHHKEKEGRMVEIDAKKYVLSPFADDQVLAETGDAPAIIAEKITKIEKLTVSDAVMKMDLLDASFLVFVNVGNNRLNLVHYRDDGNIAWVDLPSIS